MKKINGWIYILKICGYDDIYKIGATTNLDRRIKKHACFIVENVELVYSTRVTDMFMVERKVHDVLGWDRVHINVCWGWEHYKLSKDCLRKTIKYIKHIKCETI